MFKSAMHKAWLGVVGAASAAISPPPSINTPLHRAPTAEVRVAQTSAGGVPDGRAKGSASPAPVNRSTPPTVGKPPWNPAQPGKPAVPNPKAGGVVASPGSPHGASGKPATAPTQTTKPDAGNSLSLPEVVARVQKHYDGAQSYQARFEQAQLNATFGRTTRSTGEVLFKKPGRMRWNYVAPEKKMFVSNGDVLWLFEPDDKQAFRQDLRGSQLPAALAFLMGKGKLADEFNIEFAPKLSYGRPGDYRLSLKPKQVQSSYKAIYFIVDPASFHVRQTVLVDSQGNINDVTFNDMQVNVKLADSSFQWKPPAGTRVIDASKARP